MGNRQDVESQAQAIVIPSEVVGCQFYLQASPEEMLKEAQRRNVRACTYHGGHWYLADQPYVDVLRLPESTLTAEHQHCRNPALKRELQYINTSKNSLSNPEFKQLERRIRILNQAWTGGSPVWGGAYEARSHDDMNMMQHIVTDLIFRTIFQILDPQTPGHFSRTPYEKTNTFTWADWKTQDKSRALTLLREFVDVKSVKRTLKSLAGIKLKRKVSYPYGAIVLGARLVLLAVEGKLDEADRMKLCMHYYLKLKEEEDEKVLTALKESKQRKQREKVEAFAEKRRQEEEHADLEAQRKFEERQKAWVQQVKEWEEEEKAAAKAAEEDTPTDTEAKSKLLEGRTLDNSTDDLLEYLEDLEDEADMESTEFKPPEVVLMNKYVFLPEPEYWRSLEAQRKFNDEHRVVRYKDLTYEADFDQMRWVLSRVPARKRRKTKQ